MPETSQRVTLVRYAAKPDRADENEALSRAVLTELRATAPDKVVYAVFRDGVDFVHLFINQATTDSGALTDLPAFKAYSAEIGARAAAPPEITRLDLKPVESYGLATD
jgi:quinol monooxygenase YgiN